MSLALISPTISADNRPAPECIDTAKTAPKIINGVPAPELVAVRQIKMDMKRGAPGPLCSSTKVGPGTLILAAHCVITNKEGTETQVVAKEALELLGDHDRSARITNVIVNPEYLDSVRKHPCEQMDFACFSDLARLDQAVLLFDEISDPADKKDAMPIYKKKVVPEQRVTMAGFGPEGLVELSGLHGQPVPMRRKGQNTIQSADHEIIRVLGHSPEFIQQTGFDSTAHNTRAGVFTSTAPGDSGGALIVGKELAGIVSGGSEWPSHVQQFLNLQQTQRAAQLKDQIPEPYSISLFSDLNSESSQRFLKYAESQGAVFSKK